MNTIDTTSVISPRDLGLPSKFSGWRSGQWSAIEQGVASDKRFIVHSAPTGAGKSIIGVTHAILTGGRSVYLTSTKGLQDQNSRDFKSCGVVDLRGRQNYTCPQFGNCSDGRLKNCMGGVESCEYMDTREIFLKSKIGITNYSCYLSNVLHGEGMGDIDLLILDEAHAAIEELSSALEVRLNHVNNWSIYQSLSLSQPPTGSLDINRWKSWAGKSVEVVKQKSLKCKNDGAELIYLKSLDTLGKNLSRITTMDKDWIVDELTYTGETLFSPIWPTSYAEKILFRGIKHILLLSATIVPKTLALLGIPESDYLYVSHTNTFPVSRCPVYLWGATRIDHKSSHDDLLLMVNRMDNLIKHRQDRKGIIHPVSYDRQQFIAKHSEYEEFMYVPRGAELQRDLKEFRNCPAPAILNSPAVTTGYDFPGSQCEYQFLVKVPFIDMRSPVMTVRNKTDPEYGAYLVAQTIVQTCGRAMRSVNDQVENFIMDRHANWFLTSAKQSAQSKGKGYGGYRHLFPEWFIRQLVWPDVPPMPPKPLVLDECL